jgi:putative protease
MENADAAEVQVAPGSGHTMWIPLPETAVGAFVARYLTAREEAVLPA